MTTLRVTKLRVVHGDGPTRKTPRAADAFRDYLDDDQAVLIAGIPLPYPDPIPGRTKVRVVQSLRQYLAKHCIGLKVLSRQTGWSISKIRRILSLRPCRKLDDGIRGLNGWLETDARRRADGLVYAARGRRLIAGG